MTFVQTIRRYLAVLVTLAVAGSAAALPIELNDANGSRYQINTDVIPLDTVSFASGAITDATYVKPVTVTFTAVAIYAVDQPFTYNAKAGKSGTAKNS